MADIAGSIIGGLSSLVENIVNWFSTKKTNETNQKINQDNLDFQAAQTQAQWERDDTAHQREVADLKAAGLSPLANTSGAQTSQALGAPSPIAMQAPQIDANTLVNSVLQEKALNEQERHNRVQEGQKYTELAQTAEEIKNKVKELSLKDKEIENQFLYQSKYLNYLNDSLNETIAHNRNEESQKRLSIRSEEYFKSIQQQTGGKIPYKEYKDLDEYQAALNAWSDNFNLFIDQFIQETSKSRSESYSSSQSAGFDANVGVPGLGVGAGGNGSSSDSSSGSYSENISQKQQALIDNWYRKNPMPVFIHYTEN